LLRLDEDPLVSLDLIDNSLTFGREVPADQPDFACIGIWIRRLKDIWVGVKPTTDATWQGPLAIFPEFPKNSDGQLPKPPVTDTVNEVTQIGAFSLTASLTALTRSFRSELDRGRRRLVERRVPEILIEFSELFPETFSKGRAVKPFVADEAAGTGTIVSPFAG